MPWIQVSENKQDQTHKGSVQPKQKKHKPSLVGGIPTPLKKYDSQLRWLIPTEWKNMFQSTNHQYPSIMWLHNFLSLTCWARHWPTLPGKEIDMVMTKNNYCNALVKIWRSVILPFPSSCLITYQFPLVKKPCLMIKSRWIMAHVWMIETVELLNPKQEIIFWMKLINHLNFFDKFLMIKPWSLAHDNWIPMCLTHWHPLASPCWNTRFSNWNDDSWPLQKNGKIPCI